MAIYKRDRDFNHMFSEIRVDVIPLKFVRDITFYLNNDTKLVYKETNFSENDINDTHLEDFVKELPFYQCIVDLRVSIDYDLVEKYVSSEVQKLLSIE